MIDYMIISLALGLLFVLYADAQGQKKERKKYRE